MTSGSLLNWIVLLMGEAILAMFAACMFWYQDGQYSLPTPRPAALEQPALGMPLRVVAPTSCANLAANVDERPTLLHFLNPDCPCSRFNWTHVRELIARFDEQVRVVAVLETTDPQALETFQKENPYCEVVADIDGQIAHQVGVYSTPQGVVLDGGGSLFFRGNYNLGRYCTLPENEFVRRAIAACLAHEPLPEFPPAAMIARGCQLPADRPMKEATTQP